MKSKKGRGTAAIVSFLNEVVLSDDGLLRFKPTGTYDVPLCPFEEDGTVSALTGTWYESEKIAEWLKLHSEKGGRIVQSSWEGDGAAWGWEFDGRGRLRNLDLRPVGKWR